MGKDDDLESFRISDVRRPQVRGGARPKETEPVQEDESVGFPNIESMLESSSIEEISEELRLSYTQLEALSAAPDMKNKAAAKKAMVAYERVADLFEYLFETKASLRGDKN